VVGSFSFFEVAMSSLNSVTNSDAVDQLIAAMVKFSAECPPVLKDRANAVYHSKYADLGTILKVITPVLSANGLVCVQMPYTEGDVGYLRTTICHVSGQFMASSMKLEPQKQVLYKEADGTLVRAVTPQSWGSAITYARRYGISAMLSLCVDEDDDGNAASGLDSKETASRSDAKNQGAAKSEKSQTKSQAKQEEKPAEKAPEKDKAISPEAIEDIRKKIQTVELADCAKFEAALSSHGVKQTISKEVWGSLAADLLIRWAGLVPKAEVISIANKVPAYVGMGAMSQDQKTQVMAAIEALLV
jgi:hypothetical protein